MGNRWLTARPCVTAPTGGNEAVQIEVQAGPEVGYRPTRPGAMRIEDVDSRTRLAVAHTHGRSHARSRSPSAGLRARASPGSTLAFVGQCPGTRPTPFGHVWLRVHGLGAVPLQPGDAHNPHPRE